MTTKPMTKAGDLARSAFAAIDKHMKGLRGPEPPYAFCPECGSVSEHPWTNPLLVFAKEKGWYAGEVTGGRVLCATCVPVVEARELKQQARQAFAPGVPSDMRQATMENYERTPTNRDAIDAARLFLKGRESDLLLCGPTGVGKTRLAASIANECWREHGSVLFVRVPWMMTALQEAMHSAEEPAKLSDYVSPAVLVLDDVGVEKGSDYSRRMLVTLCDRRRDMGRRTVWTSNADINDFLQSTDDRLGSRFAASDIVYMDGADRRVGGIAERADERRAAVQKDRNRWRDDR